MWTDTCVKVISRTTTTTLRSHFGSSRGHSWPGLSQWLSRHPLWVWVKATRAAQHVWPDASAAQHVRTCCAEVAGSSTMTILRWTRLAATLLRRLAALLPATASVELEGRVRRLEGIVERIGGVLVPQIMKGDVDGFVGEQIGAVPVPQIWEPIVEGPYLVPRERVQNRTPEQVVDSPVPQIIEAVLPGQIMDSSMPQITEDGLPGVPQERVQNRVAEQHLGVSLCLRSQRTACQPSHRSACKIVSRSSSSMCQCLRSWRQSWIIVSRSRL